VTFLEFDGNPPENVDLRESLSLGGLRDRYLTTHGNGSLEPSTIDGMKVHFKQLVQTLGEKFPIEDLSLADLQRHADRRANMKGHKGRLSPATIRKEIVTLRTSWNWASHMGLVEGRFPSKGLSYPKSEEKPPFQTWDEIERQITAGRLTKKQQRELWDSLYLTLSETEALLEDVKANAIQPWVYPMFCFAAHTGARRAEILRALVSDVDIGGQTVLIREKKRAKGQTTSRRVPLTPFLTNVLGQWLSVHPRGTNLFSQRAAVARSKTKRSQPTPITHDEAHNHFKRTLSNTKWKVIRGYHIFRHSFISLCASRGVDQRLIDEWTGHTTDEQRKRYRHLFPTTQREAILSVFGQ
jgi:integrase